MANGKTLAKGDECRCNMRDAGGGGLFYGAVRIAEFRNAESVRVVRIDRKPQTGFWCKRKDLRR